MPYLFKTLDGVTTFVTHLKDPSSPVVPTSFDSVISLVTGGGKSFRYKKGVQKKNIKLLWARTHAISHAHFLDIKNWYENTNEADGRLNSFRLDTPAGTTFAVSCTDVSLGFQEISAGSGFYFGEINLVTIIE